MSSRPCSDLDTIAALKAHVRHIMVRAGVARAISHEQDIALQRAHIAELRLAAPTPPNAPPQEFLDANRTPGPRRLVRMQIQGHRVDLLVNPRGYADPHAEMQAWARLNNIIGEEAA